MYAAALLERIADTLIQGLECNDLLVFDTVPPGHTSRLMAATWLPRSAKREPWPTVQVR